MKNLKDVLITCTFLLLLLVTVGCPCQNNPCDDGLFCNGTEVCTPSGSQAVCFPGFPPCGGAEECNEQTDSCDAADCETDDDCDDGAFCNGVETCVEGYCQFGIIPCLEEGGECNEETDSCEAAECETDVDCDDGDLCTTDTCQDGTCVNDQVECQDNETCDPLTGLCAESETGTVGALIGATGVYSGAGTCGDDDDEVTLSLDDNTLILGGFTGNDDIPLTLTNDTTATASNVVAFEQSGHDMTIKIETEIVSLNLVHVVSGASCSSELMFAPGEPPDGYTICGPGCISPGTGGPPLSPEIWCTNQSGCSARAASCECRLVSRDRTSGGDWDHEADSNDKRKSDLANLEYRCMCLSKP